MSIETDEELAKLHASRQQKGSGGWWSQPKTVWAVAFATMVSFMGIGLVDPILPAIASDMDATEAQTELLFTSYLLITAIAMFFTSWVSGRIGAKNTLLLGLGIIVIFSLLSGFSPTVNALVGFRAVWGLGNALFISTALSTIVSEARNPDGAIILYEAALGVGMALGPLVGGLLGSIGWQFPFFGTAVLMAVSFVAIVTMLKSGSVQKKHTSPLASIKALGRPQLLSFGLVAIFYNMAFFVILAVSPFPLGFGALGIGFTFCGWGIALAVMSVFGAPALTRQFHRTTVLAGGLIALLAVMVAAIFLVENVVALVVLIVISGFVLGIMNTVLTEASMESTDLPRPVASAAYSGVRFLGGSVAPPIASALGHSFVWSASYVYGAAATVVALILFFSLWHFVKAANKGPHVDHQEMELDEAEALIGDAD
ncbi:MFS transporter [Galactobacter sp.]|uniref:MFS transporter n=1 Tax=Galactobacter sp. TaxID=2676125 RepID=UPI0025C46BE5|nr:MFS transporter [Galactobacter sp.]